ncbi:MAG: hypothetical protein IKI40_10945, partial [Treponema sp.]|nr:hypothetical protein [Treponema sp.]
MVYKVYMTGGTRQNMSFYGDLISVYGMLAGSFDGDGIACNVLRQIIESGKEEGRFEFIRPFPMTREKNFLVKYLSFYKEGYGGEFVEVCITSNKVNVPELLLHCTSDRRCIVRLLYGLTKSKHLCAFFMHKSKLKKHSRHNGNDLPLLIDNGNYPLDTISLQPEIFPQWNKRSIKSIKVRKNSGPSSSIKATSLVEYVIKHPHAVFLKERKIIGATLCPQLRVTKEEVPDKKEVENKDLLVHGGKGVCPENQVHNNKTYTVSVPVFNKEDEAEAVDIKSSYCPKCNAWFVTDLEFRTLTRKGLVCCRNAAYDDFSKNKAKYLGN